MENNIKSISPLTIIKNIIVFSLCTIPLIAGLAYGITQKETMSNIISIIVLGMAVTFILMGFMGGNKKNYDGSILAGIGLLLSVVSMGVYFFGSILIFLG